MVHALTAQGRSPAERRALFDARGLAVPSCHVFLDALDEERRRAFDDVAALGAGYVVCAWIPPERRRDADDYRRLAELLREAGEEARRERACGSPTTTTTSSCAPSTASRSGLDILLEAVDPALLAVELDVYWVARRRPRPRGRAGAAR